MVNIQKLTVTLLIISKFVFLFFVLFLFGIVKPLVSCILILIESMVEAEARKSQASFQVIETNINLKTGLQQHHFSCHKK